MIYFDCRSNKIVRSKELRRTGISYVILAKRNLNMIFLRLYLGS